MKTASVHDALSYYFVDLTKRNVETRFYPRADLMREVAHLGLKSAADLNTYDLRLFETEHEADAFREKYVSTLKSLDNKKICKSRELSALLYKRRYMVLTLMGLKNQTFRHYLKPFKRGQLINLFDQSFFLTVKIKNVIKHAPNKYEYKFKLP